MRRICFAKCLWFEINYRLSALDKIKLGKRPSKVPVVRGKKDLRKYFQSGTFGNEAIKLFTLKNFNFTDSYELNSYV